MSELVLGWQVTMGMEPRSWLGGRPDSPEKRAEGLFTVPAPLAAAHTVIVGQSGSGKSSFLGRLVEEIALHTRSRFLILDPNSDFGRVDQVESENLWTEARYDAARGGGRLPHEDSRDAFLVPWENISKQVVSQNRGYVCTLNEKTRFCPLKIWWPSLSAEMLADGDDPVIRNQYFHCHAFTQAVGYLTVLKSIAVTPEANREEITWLNPLDIAEGLQANWSNFEPGPARVGRFAARLQEVFPEASLAATAERIGQLNEVLLLGNNPGSGEFTGSINRATLSGWYREITAALQYITDDVARSYFGKAREYETAGIFESRPDASAGNYRINVLDIPSLPNKNTRLLAVSNLVTNEWTRSRIAWQKALELSREEDSRVPTFIVVDEAHNIVPAEPTNRAEFSIREQFRTIAAEGRKYGLFLVLASQRPDKLDRLILSECENKAVMKLDSESILNLTRKELGLEDIPLKVTDKCLEFGLGRVLLAGRWTGGQPKIFYAAARRTIEGGRNLRPEYWAQPD
jgi:hypothetical protein